MIKKENFIVINEKYKSGIAVEVYKNEISLCQAYEDKDGKLQVKWIYPQKDHEPSKKAMPHKIPLGLKQQAIQRLEQLLLMIEKL